MSEPKGPSPFVILAQRLAFVDKLPFHAIGDIVDQFWPFAAPKLVWQDHRWTQCANDYQWASGDAFCTTCDHRWAAVAPVGTVWLECPGCKRETGLFKFKHAIDPEQLVRHCNCGNALFYLTQEGHLCPNCGIYQRY